VKVCGEVAVAFCAQDAKMVIGMVRRRHRMNRWIPLFLFMVILLRIDSSDNIRYKMIP
jgi:hypothetical protein